MSEPITNLPDAVAELGALPLPVGVPVAALREEPHDSPLHHDYRVGRDLPELGGQR